MAEAVTGARCSGTPFRPLWCCLYGGNNFVSVAPSLIKGINLCEVVLVTTLWDFVNLMCYDVLNEFLAKQLSTKEFRS